MAERSYTITRNGQTSTVTFSRDDEAGVTQHTVNGQPFEIDRTAPVITSDPAGESRPLLDKLVGGAMLAYSFRDLNSKQGDSDVANIRRSGDNEEKIFKAKDVPTIDEWVNGKQETTLPADVASSSAAYSLRKVKASYSGNVVRIRRSSDDIEVDVAFDYKEKLGASSSVTNVVEPYGVEKGSTSATDLTGFLNESVSGFTSVPYSGTNSAHKNFTSDPTISNTAFSGTNGGTQSRVIYSNTTDSLVTASDFGGCKVKVTGTVNTLSGGDLIVKPSILSTGGGTWTPSEGNKVISDGTTGAFEYIFTGDGTNGFHSVVFLIDASTTVNVSNLTFEYIEHGARVVTWYDQSGNAEDAFQLSADKQPKIADNGALLDGILFDNGSGGTDGIHLAANTHNIGGAQNNLVVAVVDRNSLSSSHMGTIVSTRSGNDGFTYGIHANGYSQTFHTGAGNAGDSNDPVPTLGKVVLSFNKSGGTGTQFKNGTEISLTSTLSGYTTSDGVFNIGTIKRPNVNASNGLRGFLSEVICYSDNQTSKRFKIESNINNYYGVYNDANATSDTAFSFHGERTNGTSSADGLNGFTLDVQTAAAYAGFKLKEKVGNTKKLYVSFNAVLTGGNDGAASPQFKLRSSNIQGAGESDTYDVVEGFNSFYVTSNDAQAEYVSFSEGDDNRKFTISDFRVSRAPRDGRVETWYDQSGGGYNMTQEQESLQPYRIQNGGTHDGIFAPRNLAITGQKIALFSDFGNQHFPANTTKLCYIVVGEKLTALGNGNDKGTIFGAFRGVGNYIAGQHGIVVQPTGKFEWYYGITSDVNDFQNSTLVTTGDNQLENKKVLLIASVDNTSVTLSSNTQSSTTTPTRIGGAATVDLNLTSAASTDSNRNYIRLFAPNRDNGTRAHNYSYGTITEAILYANDHTNNLPAIKANINNQYQIYS